MDKSDLTQVVIPKEDAVFWMDRFGRWHNEGGIFAHKKIIDYFNASIRFDENGYFVEQVRENVCEKVYFRYEETPLFVVDVVMAEPLELMLNTGEAEVLRPDDLFVFQDRLYQKRGDEIIKFNERVLLRLADYIDYDESHYYFKISGVCQRIEERDVLQ